MTKNEVMEYLASKGSEQTIRIFRNHGCESELFGVKVGDLKPLQKQIKNDHPLAMELFETKNSDAQYLAGLIADPKAFSIADFERWADLSTWYMISEYALAWNLAENENCMLVCKDWINSSDPIRKSSGWAALAAHLGITKDENLPYEDLAHLLKKAESELSNEKGRVAYTMNGFIIALGGVTGFTDQCIEIGKRIGKIEIDMGKTSCKVPYIPDYIDNMIKRDRIGKKKKTAKC